MRFRSKPVHIEAVQFNVAGDHPSVVTGFTDATGHLWLDWAVKGAQGWSRVDPGDWIIAEPFGPGHYPCKPDVFASKYEVIE